LFPGEDQHAWDVPKICNYIARQQHHRKQEFQVEYRGFLADNGIEFDERYGWE
jgi:hypothetical protein